MSWERYRRQLAKQRAVLLNELHEAGCVVNVTPDANVEVLYEGCVLAVQSLSVTMLLAARQGLAERQQRGQVTSV